jgi:hypothetical protein
MVRTPTIDGPARYSSERGTESSDLFYMLIVFGFVTRFVFAFWNELMLQVWM